MKKLSIGVRLTLWYLLLFAAPSSSSARECGFWRDGAYTASPMMRCERKSTI